MTDVSELKTQHGAIQAAARHLLDVAVPGRGYRAAACGLLHELAARIDAHAATESGFVWRGGEPEPELLAQLAQDWKAYRATWSTGRIAIDWAGFAAATQALMPRMLARIDREQACLDAALSTPR